MADVANTLVERGQTYGLYIDQATKTQELKNVMGNCVGWHRLAPDQRESLEMIASKIGRILNGDPNYVDSWHDIAGYAKLVEDRLVGVDSNKPTIEMPKWNPQVVTKEILFPDTKSFGGVKG